MTRALTDRERVEIWEAGLGRLPWERAVLALSIARREAPGALLALPVGRRDAALLDLYERNFGATLRGSARCPGCAADLEFDAPVDVARRAPCDRAEAPLTLEGCSLTLRPPDSADVALALRDVSAPRETLLRRCVTRAVSGEAEVSADALPAAVLDAVEGALAALDPQADVVFSLECAVCGCAWAAPFDVAAFVWAELAAAVRRIFDEVFALARAFGWSESEALAMGPRRRAVYLERLS